MSIASNLISMLEDFEIENEQSISSAKTSVNILPRTFKIIEFQPDTINLDYGGGRFEKATDFLRSKGVTNLVYDPYNRSQSHNDDVLATIKKNNGADTITCNNVLNVIKEESSRNRVIRNIHFLLKDSGTAYFLIYNGDNSGVAKETKSGYQNNRPTKSYLDEIRSVFSDVTIKKDVIIAKK